MKLFRSLSAPFRRKKLARDLEDELRFHMEKQMQTNVAAGMSPQEAWRQAGISFGGVQQARENVREIRWGGILEILAQDTRYALRMLRKSPAFTTVAVLTLALGIGMNTATFSLISAVLFRSLPVRDPHQLVVFRWASRQEPKVHMGRNFGDCEDSRDGLAGCTFSLPFFQAVQRESGVFSGVAAWAGNDRMILSGNGPAAMIEGAGYVSGGCFQTLGVGAALGRTLTEADDTPTSPPVAVLNYVFWQRFFGGSPSVIGKVIKLNGTPVTIVGVAEPKFQRLTLASRHDLWLPLSLRRQLAPDWKPRDEDAGSLWLIILARVKPENLGQAQAAMNLLFRNETMHGDKPLYKADAEPRLELHAAQQELTGDSAERLRPMYVMLLCVCLVLLIACANVAGLQLARSAARQKEIAVRLMLGARRSRLVRQLLVESMLLSAMGALLGLVLAIWAARGLLVLVEQGTGEAVPFSPQLDWHVLGFTAALAILTGLLFGLAPALRGLRPDLTHALKSAGEAGATPLRRRFSLRNLLVAGQLALAIVVLVTAGLLVHTLVNLINVNPGFDTRNVLVFGIDPTMAGYKEAQVDHLYTNLQEQFAALPGVADVSYSWVPPLGPGIWITGVHLPGTPPKAEAEADFFPVGPGFFSTMHVPLLLGRDFTAADFNIAAAKGRPTPSQAPTPVLINQVFVNRHFSKTNPIGQRFGELESEQTERTKSPGYEVVGVVGNAKYYKLSREIHPTIYAPMSGQQAFFELRTKGEPTAVISSVRKIVNQRDSNLALFSFSTETELIKVRTFEQRFIAQLSSLFGVLALLLACLGLYGLLSYEVTQRTREIGIRMAVGARRPDVVRLVLRQAVVLVLAGAVVGVAAALGVARVLSSLLYGVKTTDPVTLISVAIVLAVVAFVACYLPARRATRVDPLVALRYE